MSHLNITSPFPFCFEVDVQSRTEDDVLFASGAKTAAGAGKNVAKSANKADNIGQVVDSCPKGSKACFTAGTQIVVGAEFTEDNVFVDYVTVNIEDIAVGDLVYSYDTVTGIVSQQEVTETFALESDHINYLLLWLNNLSFFKFH